MMGNGGVTVRTGSDLFSLPLRPRPAPMTAVLSIMIVAGLWRTPILHTTLEIRSDRASLGISRTMGAMA